jgi:putative ABC transport system permease protein
MMRALERTIGVYRRVVAVVRRRRLERDLNDELAFHLAMRAADHARLGATDEDAARAARRQFGNVTAIKEQTRDMWTFPSFESIRQDVRYGSRMLRRSPGFTIVAVLALAIGIGANTAIFSLVDGLFIRGLPYPDAGRLVLLIGNVQRAAVERRGNSYPDFLDWKTRSTSFVGMAAYTQDAATLSGSTEPERLTLESVSPSYFSLLGVTPTYGRVFRDAEDAVAGRDAVCVLSDGLWKRRFGADPAIVGQTIRLDGRAYTVVGIMPAGFTGLTDLAELWRPFMMSGWDPAARGSRGFNALARLRPGVTPAAAQAELAGISRQLERAYPDTNAKRAVEVAPLADELFGTLKGPVVILMIAVLIVLLVACANVANLLIGRSEARQREIAVRTALGAGRQRLVRQLITESVLLTGIAAVAGVGLAYLAIPALVASSPITLPTFFTPAIDLPVLGFTVGAAAACGLLLGLAPALHTRLAGLANALKDSARGSSAQSWHSRRLLVVTEVTLAVVLAVTAGLMMRSVQKLTAIDPGFNPRGVLAVSISIPRAPQDSQQPATPGDRTAAPKFVASSRVLLERVQGLPGVQSAALASDLPLDGQSGAVFYQAEGDTTTDAQTRPRAYVHRVTPGFFQTLGIALHGGRTFTDTDPAQSVIVSDRVVRRFWPTQDPIGKHIQIGSNVFSIVGVVDETKYRGRPDNPTADPDLYFPFVDRGLQSLAVRTALDPAALGRSLRAAIHDVDPSIVVYGETPLEDLVATQTAPPRFTTWLMGLFAGTALLLAVIGVYGVMAYFVAQRRREFGIRLALGADPRGILKLVVAQGARLIAIGVALGGVASYFLGRALQTVLFGVEPTDPSAVAAVALLAVVALLACYLPARRATHVDPALALRNE